MSAYAQRALIGGLPPDPHITVDALLSDSKILPAAEDKICDFSCLGPLGPTN